MPRAAKNPLAALARAARAQIIRGEEMGKSVDTRMKVAKAASPEWTPNDSLRADFMSVTATLQHAGNALIKATEANKKSLEGLSDDQLNAQMRAEIISAVQSMTDEEWQRCLDARAKVKR